METVCWRCVSVLGALLLLTATAPSQEVSTPPLGDVAREQKQTHSTAKKTAKARVYVAVGSAADADVAEGQSSPKKKETQEKVAEVARVRRSSMFDQSRNQPANFVIVPAGTEIRVDIVDGKVIVPVRVGFATPVPALSRAAVNLNQVYYGPVSYSLGPPLAALQSYGETAELTAITVRGVTYPVQARRVSLSGAPLGPATSLSSSRDAVFVLEAPLAIAR